MNPGVLISNMSVSAILSSSTHEGAGIIEVSFAIIDVSVAFIILSAAIVVASVAIIVVSAGIIVASANVVEASTAIFNATQPRAAHVVIKRTFKPSSSVVPEITKGPVNI